MAKRPILRAGNPVLRRPARKIKSFDESLQALVRDMTETMRDAPGIGLAAPQIGVPLRVFVAQVSLEREGTDDDEEVPAGRSRARKRRGGGSDDPDILYVLCNPEIVKVWGEEESEEGCLSLPGYVGEVARATRVLVKGQDVSGKRIRVRAKGLLARVFQHEIDHLKGLMFTDRLESMDKLRRLEPAEDEPET